MITSPEQYVWPYHSHPEWKYWSLLYKSEHSGSHCPLFPHPRRFQLCPSSPWLLGISHWNRWFLFHRPSPFIKKKLIKQIFQLFNNFVNLSIADPPFDNLAVTLKPKFLDKCQSWWWRVSIDLIRFYQLEVPCGGPHYCKEENLHDRNKKYLIVINIRLDLFTRATKYFIILTFFQWTAQWTDDFTEPV